MTGSIIAVLLLSYLIGGLPFGWLIVKIASGRDLRTVASGRTGGTNAMRAAGFLAGFLTAVMDVLKGVSTAWLVSWLGPESDWLRAAAALMAMVGQIFPIYMLERREDGRLHIRGGGAGGATALGGAIALWASSAWFIVPAAFLVYVFVGYASLTTITIAAGALLTFIVRAALGAGPWQHILYGIGALLMVLYALIPNIQRLRAGTERKVGLRGYLQKRRQTPPGGR